MSDGMMLAKIPAGDNEKDYGIGDLLNAVDAVVCYFREFRGQSDTEMLRALRLYADGLDKGGVNSEL